MANDASSALAEREKVQQFLNAARNGNLELFKKLTAEFDDGKGLAKAVTDIKDANKRGALHFAALDGQIDVCKYLLEELKIDVDQKDEEGETPLIHAARNGHTATAKYLIEQGADPTASGDFGTTALHHAAGKGDTELLIYLLGKGLNSNLQSDAGTPLVWAAGHGHLDAVRILLDYQADPNIETEDGVTPLLSAVAADSLACVDLLIEHGAHVNMRAGGATPLHVAADNKNPDIIVRLLRAGANPNSTDDDEEKPIQIAAARGNRAAVEILFPLTTRIEAVPQWTVDGLIEYMQSKIMKQQEEEEKSKSVRTPVPKKDLPEVTPEAKQRAAEAKSRGHDAYKRNDYYMAVDAFTQAIDFDPTDATLFSNRSLCWIRLGQAEYALDDAKACLELRPDWPKAYYREGAAFRLMQRYEEAANAFYEGVKLDPENVELVNAFREAVEAGRRAHGVKKEQS